MFLFFNIHDFSRPRNSPSWNHVLDANEKVYNLLIQRYKPALPLFVSLLKRIHCSLCPVFFQYSGFSSHMVFLRVVCCTLFLTICNEHALLHLMENWRASRGTALSILETDVFSWKKKKKKSPLNQNPQFNTTRIHCNRPEGIS